MTYADSGFIASLYLNETTSAEATRIVTGLSEKVTVTWLTELEFENALWRAVFTQRIELTEALSLKAKYESNKAQGTFDTSKLDGMAMSIEASRLAILYTPTIGTRTLDLLHVAAANLMQCERVLSFDERQRKVASALGIQVLPT